MENTTNFNQTMKFNFRYSVWLLDTTINGLLVAISLYLMAALVFHEVKIDKRRERFLSLSIEKKYATLSSYTCIIIAVASFVRQGVSFGGNWIEFCSVSDKLSSSEEAVIERTCRILPHLSNFALTVGSGMVFHFLWFRQRVFYIHPSLKLISNTCVRMFSFGVITAWIVFYISLYPVYFILVHYHYVSGFGCLVIDSSFESYLIITITWGIASILMQLVLLFLFVYPILKRGMWKLQRKDECLMKRVKKAVILTSICLGTDVISILLAEFLSVKNANIPFFNFGVNLVINHAVTIACFDHWKQLLWPWNLNQGVADSSSGKTSSTTPPHNRGLDGTSFANENNHKLHV